MIDSVGQALYLGMEVSGGRGGGHALPGMLAGTAAGVPIA